MIIKLRDIKINDIINIIEDTTCEYITRLYEEHNNNLTKVYNQYIKQNLRYNTKTGKLISSEGVLSEYCYKKDIPTYDNMIDLIEEQFIHTMLCECGRLNRVSNKGR